MLELAPGTLFLKPGLLAEAPGDAGHICQGGSRAKKGGGISRLGLQTVEFFKIPSVLKKIQS